MVEVVDSHLYKYLLFLRKYDPGYNVKEVFNLILGYQMALNQETVSVSAKERWISDLNDFIEKQLIFEHYNNDRDKLPKNYGEIIYENQSDDKDGLEKFFSLLNQFSNKKNPPNKCF